MQRVAYLMLTAVGLAAPASSQVLTIGTTDARRCYLAADARIASADALNSCDLALVSGDARTRVATHVNRGILRLLTREDASALADFDAALAIDGRQPEAWLNKGVALVRADRPTEAVEALDRALGLETKRPALAHFARAYAYEDMGRVGAAYRDLRTAASLSPTWEAPRRELRRFRVRSAAGGGAGQGTF